METKQQFKNFDSNGFWKHSLAVGVTTKLIAQKRNIEKKNIEDYFIAGLLHDLGILVEAKLFPEEFQRILLSTESLGILDAEEVILDGLNHCSIGKALAQQWVLSEELCTVMLKHHDPLSDQKPSALVLSVYIANILCKKNRIGLVLDKSLLSIDTQVFQMLGIDASIEHEILKILDAEITKATEFLKV